MAALFWGAPPQNDFWGALAENDFWWALILVVVFKVVFRVVVELIMRRDLLTVTGLIF